jgi:hypothetical protein
VRHSHSSPIAFRTQATIRRLLDDPGLPLARHLSSDCIRQAYLTAGRHFRQRLFSPAVTVWMFLIQMLDPDHSCRKAVARLLAYLSALGLRPCSADNGGYCKARKRLPESVLRDLTRSTGQSLAEQARQAWLWKNRPVKIVDGTGVSMPDTAQNRKAYPPGSRATFPVMRLVVIFSLTVGSVLEAAMGGFRGKGGSELSLLRSLGDVFQPGDVWVADRLYSTFWVVAQAMAAGADLVMRWHAGRRQPVWRRGRGHNRGNRRVAWLKPARPSWMSPEEYQAMPDVLHLRALKVEVRRRGFRTRQLLLVTTLTDAAAYPSTDLAELYRRRWQAELDLRALKVTLQMDVLRGKTPEMVRKEVWGHLLAYNLVRTVMAEAAEQGHLRPDELSFAGAWQTVHSFSPYLRLIENEEQAWRLWQGMLVALTRHRVGKRPNRIEPRAVKRRPKQYPTLKGTRAAARQRLRNGASACGHNR